MRITYTSDPGSRSFWLILYDSQPIYHRISTDIPPTVNGQGIGWVSAARSIDTQPMYWSTYWLTLGQYIGRYVDRDISVGISAQCRSICWSTYRSSVGRYISRYLGRVSVDMSTDISVEGCTKYTWSLQTRVIRKMLAETNILQLATWQKINWLNIIKRESILPLNQKFTALFLSNRTYTLQQSHLHGANTTEWTFFQHKVNTVQASAPLGNVCQNTELFLEEN